MWHGVIEEDLRLINEKGTDDIALLLFHEMALLSIRSLKVDKSEELLLAINDRFT